VPWIAPVTLTGKSVTLEPLSKEHHDELAAAASDGELWNLWYTNVPEPGAMMAEIERRLDLQARGSMLPFTVIERASGHAAGMTTYMNIDAENRRVEIGSTWLRKSVQRTALNTECKLLLLSHAFDALGCIAVEFRTSSANAQSRAAIERLGAQLDGILRSHALHKNGTLRDTVVYSITAAEWPAIRARLCLYVARPGAILEDER
jgi:RimJ/RimL family protein N-acetyltransferase